MSAERIPMLDVVAQNGPLMDSLEEAAIRVLRSGRYILGPEVDELEKEVAELLGVEHAIGVSSGTDALLVALMALGIGPGDEVITTPFTFFATGGCIARVGARPVFVDIDPETFNLDPVLVEGAITEQTKAIMPVHLFGQSCDMKLLQALARQHNISIIEDAAQAIGAAAENGPVGGLGHYGCFSFFPSKNLGGFGDGGLVTTNHAELAERARVMRVHGGKPKYYHAVIGGNFRLDPLQAALLRVKLAHLGEWTALRRQNAAAYDVLFAKADLPRTRLSLPVRRSEGHVYNQYVIRTDRRDDLMAHLKAQEIDSAIYYPVPLHLQDCFAYLGYREGSLPICEQAAEEVLALPVFPELGEHRQHRIVETVLNFLTQ